LRLLAKRLNVLLEPNDDTTVRLNVVAVVAVGVEAAETMMADVGVVADEAGEADQAEVVLVTQVSLGKYLISVEMQGKQLRVTENFSD
jgi:hypothetical protein